MSILRGLIRTHLDLRDQNLPDCYISGRESGGEIARGTTLRLRYRRKSLVTGVRISDGQFERGAPIEIRRLPRLWIDVAS